MSLEDYKPLLTARSLCSDREKIPAVFIASASFRSLVGRKIEQAAYTARFDAEVELKDEWSFDKVDTHGQFIPAHIAGRIHLQQGIPIHLHLA